MEAEQVKENVIMDRLPAIIAVRLGGGRVYR